MDISNQSTLTVCVLAKTHLQRAVNKNTRHVFKRLIVLWETMNTEAAHAEEPRSASVL